MDKELFTTLKSDTLELLDKLRKEVAVYTTMWQIYDLCKDKGIEIRPEIADFMALAGIDKNMLLREADEKISRCIIGEDGAIRHAMSRAEAVRAYKVLEEIQTNATSQEIAEYNEAIKRVQTLLHSWIKY